jgi:tetratricopeptide (TPR) repeat protein
MLDAVDLANRKACVKEKLMKNKKSTVLILVLFFFCFTGPSLAQNKDYSPEEKEAIEFIKKGNVHFRNKDFEKAIPEYQKAVNAAPRMYLPNKLLAYTYMELHQKDEAIKAYSKAIDAEPNDPSTYIALAQIYVRFGLNDEAIKQYNKALALSPDNLDAYFGRSESHFLKGDYDEAVYDMGRIFAIDRNYKKLNDYYLFLNRKRFNITDPKKVNYSESNKVAAKASKLKDKKTDAEAIKIYTEALKFYPMNHSAYFNRAKRYMSQENYKKAVEDFSYAISNSPTMVKYYEGRAEAHKALRDMVAYNRDMALAKEFKDRKAAKEKAASSKKFEVNKKNSFDDYLKKNAKKILQEAALKAKKDAAEPYTNSGDVKKALKEAQAYKSKKEWEKAVGLYSRVIATAPEVSGLSNDEYATTLYQRGLSYLNITAKRFEAKQDFIKAIELKPDLAEAYVEKARLDVKSNKFSVRKEGFADFDKAIELNPRLADAYYYKALALSNKQGTKYSDIFQNFEKAIELDPNNKQYRELYAVKLEKAGALDKAIEQYSVILKQDQTDGRTYLKKGKLLHKAKDINKALNSYSMAIHYLSGSWKGEAYANRGLLFMDAKNYDNAIKDFTMALSISSTYGTYWGYRALAYEKKGDLKNSESDWTNQIKRTKLIKNKRTGEYSEYALTPFKQRANFYMRSKQYAKAKKDFQKILELKPSDESAKIALKDIEAKLSP